MLTGSSVITICTKNRECYFGEIYNKCMKLLQLGVIADILWYEILNHAKNVDLGNFVVMPNHIHGILILNGNVSDSNSQTKPENKISKFHNVTVDDPVETRYALSLSSIIHHPTSIVFSLLKCNTFHHQDDRPV